MPRNVLKKRENNLVKRALNLLSMPDRRKIFAVVLIQVIFGVLDLIGVALLGVLGALAISGSQSSTPGNRVSSVLEFLNISGNSVQVQASIIGVLAATLLISKTFFSIFFVRRTIYFLARKNAELSSQLLSKVLSQSLTDLQSKSMQEILFAVTSGTAAIIMGILNTSILVISDISLLIILGSGLFVVDPLIAFSTLCIFSLVAYVLYRLLQIRAEKLGENYAETSIAYSERLLEVLNSYREILVRNRRKYYAKKIGAYGNELANVRAEQAFMPNISKYVIEITMVIGGLLIGATQFSTQDAAHAVAVLTIFLAASTRLAPAVLRLQQGALTIKSISGTAVKALDLIENLKDIKTVSKFCQNIDFSHEGFVGEIQLTNVSLKYEDNALPAIVDLTLNLAPGKVLALVGPSGSGKTSTVDVILGVRNPDSGDSKISGLNPLEAIETWPGAIGYVPQDVLISNSSIRANVCLGYDEDKIYDDLVWEALKVAHLDEFVKTLPNKLDTVVGDRGAKLSGGQRQRLGIARAMFTKPKLLILDEATSALDATTEANISESIQELRGNVSVLMVAHRLSTIRAADQVIYLDGGKIKSAGSFNQVRKEVPEFDQQARLMGL